MPFGNVQGLQYNRTRWEHCAVLHDTETGWRPAEEAFLAVIKV